MSGSRRLHDERVGARTWVAVAVTVLLAGCGGGAGLGTEPDTSAAASPSVLGTSAAATTSSEWDFSEPSAIDAQTAISALVAGVAVYPDYYSGVSISVENGITSVVVHLVRGHTMRDDVDSFMAAAVAAGVRVSTDTVKYSLTELNATVAAIPGSASLGAAGLVVSSRIDVDTNSVVVTVSELTPALSAAVTSEFKSRVSLVQATG